jgi:hypothetical protein
MLRKPARVAPRARLALIAGLACSSVVMACGDDAGSASDATPSGLVGGWSNAAEQRLACVARDGRLWIGDSSTEIGGPSYCALSGDGTGFHCSAREGEAAFDGTLDLTAETLTLAIEPCPSSSPDDCSASYQRDANVRCE